MLSSIIVTFYPQILMRTHFHNKKHPKDLGKEHIEAFLTNLAVNNQVSPSTQNQAFNALLFLYRQVLNIPLEDENIQAIRAKRRERVPVVLVKEEVKELIAQLEGVYQLMAKIIYGGGLRLLECLRLRVQNIDFSSGEIHLIDTKGQKDRITFLPRSAGEDLKDHLSSVRLLHRQDLEKGFGEVYLPGALARKYPKAGHEWRWQYVFPAKQLSIDPRSGIKRRHHLHETSFGREIKKTANKIGIIKRVSAHTLRHSFATHLLQNGVDIRNIQELLGHKDVSTTMIYTHVLRNLNHSKLKSPLDLILGEHALRGKHNQTSQ